MQIRIKVIDGLILQKEIHLAYGRMYFFFQKGIYHLQVFVLHRNNKGRPAERVHAVDVEALALLLVLLVAFLDDTATYQINLMKLQHNKLIR